MNDVDAQYEIDTTNGCYFKELQNKYENFILVLFIVIYVFSWNGFVLFCCDFFFLWDLPSLFWQLFYIECIEIFSLP